MLGSRVIWRFAKTTCSLPCNAKYGEEDECSADSECEWVENWNEQIESGTFPGVPFGEEHH